MYDPAVGVHVACGGKLKRAVRNADHKRDHRLAH
jgi:hypothetical protein